jgi:hypothetical protein
MFRPTWPSITFFIYLFYLSINIELTLPFKLIHSTDGTAIGCILSSLKVIGVCKTKVLIQLQPTEEGRKWPALH